MASDQSKTVFQTLNSLNVNGHTEKKKTGSTELTYLSWAWAWAEVKKAYENVSYEIKTFYDLPYVYDDKTGYMVFTSVTIEGITHDMWLPVMDGANRAMKTEPYEYQVKNPLFKYAKEREDGKFYDKYGNEQTEFITKKCEAATMMDINKTIMRCLVKNLAMFGLGLYIYSGEDLPEGDESAYIPQSAEISAEEVEDAQRSAEIAKQPIGEARAKSLTAELIRNGADPIKVLAMYKGVSRLADLTERQQLDIITNMKRVVEKCPYEKYPYEGVTE